MVASPPPDLGAIRPDRCALFTDSGARANEVVDRATIDIIGLRRKEKKKTYDRLLSPRRMPGIQPSPNLYRALYSRVSSRNANTVDDTNERVTV